MDSLNRKLEKIFQKMGSKPEQSRVMASQLIKRAEQISKVEQISKEEALKQLLEKIMDHRS